MEEFYYKYLHCGVIWLMCIFIWFSINTTKQDRYDNLKWYICGQYIDKKKDFNLIKNWKEYNRYKYNMEMNEGDIFAFTLWVSSTLWAIIDLADLDCYDVALELNNK